jgi:dynein heavy chain, axonemal
MFERYVEPAMEFIMSSSVSLAVPGMPYVNLIQTLCNLLEGLLSDDTTRGSQARSQQVLEANFVFACVWGLGGCLQADKRANHRAAFSQWWVEYHVAATKTSVPFPKEGSVFDYFPDQDTGTWRPWVSCVPRFDLTAACAAATGGASAEDNFADGSAAPDMTRLFVPTVDTVRMLYLARLLLKNGHHIMLVGGAGTGKTTIAREFMRSLDPENYIARELPLNSLFDGPSMQEALETSLEKKSGSRYGPPGTKRLVLLLDDSNMPAADKYETQTALELLRQGIDSGGWFDKHKTIMKEVSGVHVIAAMNLAAGERAPSARVLRHFAAFVVPTPTAEDMTSMCVSILRSHLDHPGWSNEVRNMGPSIVQATVELHCNVIDAFLPSAEKFHYIFSLRELSSVMAGLLRMTATVFGADPLKCARLWAHEVERTYADRFVSDDDLAMFYRLRAAAARRWLEQCGVCIEDIERGPLIYASLSNDAGQCGGTTYDEIPSEGVLRSLLERKLAEYNESNASMDLVLFSQASHRVVRLARALSFPGGHAVMVGVGGSGKQSLARLAAHCAGCETYQIQLTPGYAVAEFRADLLGLMQRCAARSARIALILTDANIVDDRMLACVNELLATGQVSNLFAADEREALISAVRAEVRMLGLPDSQEACWEHALGKIRRNLHFVLCFSPVGPLRGRARRFPAIVGRCYYDWLRPWPRVALESVAARFLANVSALDSMASNDTQAADAQRSAIVAAMASAHGAAQAASDKFQQQYRRYNYVTPKSYLELVATYQSTLEKGAAKLYAARSRLESGTSKILHAKQAVQVLREELMREQVVVDQKQAATAVLIETIGREKLMADEAVEAGRGDEELAAALAEEVRRVQAECAADLAIAEPIIAAAEAALSSLDKASLGELKSFSNPSQEVTAVVAACMILTASGAGAIPKDVSWPAGKKWMGSAGSLDNFLKMLLNFDKDRIPVACVDKVEGDYITKTFFAPESIRVKSAAAAGLCAWVINVCKYFRIYETVAPKRAALANANRKLNEANLKLTGIRSRVAALQGKVHELETALAAAIADKVAAQAAADKTAAKMNLADRLISGLAAEFDRWTASIKQLQNEEGELYHRNKFGFCIISAPMVSQFNLSLLVF